MAEKGSELIFFRGIRVKIYIRTNISISIRPTATKFGKQAYPDEYETNQAGTGDVISSRDFQKIRLPFSKDYDHKIWTDYEETPVS